MDKKLRQLSIIKNRFETCERCYAERLNNPLYCEAIPTSLGIKLTNRCNLRCTHCFEWSVNGYHHNMDKRIIAEDIPLSMILDLLLFTKPTKAPLYLWGGEPTIYKDWNELCNLICEYDRDVVICTNGVNISHLADSLCMLGERVTLLFSIEGFIEQHDAIRGKGMYSQTMETLQLFSKLKNDGKYKVFLSVETVVSDALIPCLKAYCNSYKNTFIDSLYLNFPWFINPDVALSMDKFFEKEIKNICCCQALLNKNYSWHSFDFKISRDFIHYLVQTLKEIKEIKYPFKIHFNPNLEKNDLIDYLNGEDIYKNSAQMCLSYSQRLDILPNGDICPCKKYPELTIGNLNHDSIEKLWNGVEFKNFRRTINNRLMPICSKCELFYAYNKGK